MITITKQNDGVLFTFQDSDKYLYGNGSILVPFNTLSIVADESDMITLKKAASNDVFLSARYDTDLGYRSKDDAIDDLKDMLFAETGGGSGSGVTPSEVQEMIDESISGKADASALTAHADNANVHFSGTQKSNYDGLEAQYYVDDNWDVMPMSVFNDFTNDYSMAMGQFDQRISANTSAVTAVANDVQTVSGQVQTKVATSDFNAYSAATATAIGNKQDALQYYEENTEEGWAEMKVTSDDGEGSTGDNHINIGGGVAEIGIYNEYDDGQGNVTSNNTSIYADQIMVTLQAGITENGDTTSTEFSVEATGVTINGDAVATEPYVDAALSGKADTSAVTAVNDALTAHTANTTVHVTQVEKDAWNAKVDTSAITTAITSGSTDAQVPTAKATYDAIQAGGGGVTVDPTLDTGSTNPVANSAITTAIDAKADKTAAFGSYSFGESTNGVYLQYRDANGNNKNSAIYYPKINGKDILTTNGTYARNNYNFQLVETTAITTSMTSSSTDAQVPSAKAVYDQLGGLKFVQCTQSEYDSMVSGGTIDSSTIYFITNVVS